MAKSKYEYVKSFEQSDVLLPHTWIVIRIDGRGFTRFAQVHGFKKPNDEQALHLMNEGARAVLEDIPEICFGYGVSDEYSFVLRKSSTLYQRRASKLVSIIVSMFSATYVMKWGHINNQYNTCYWSLVQSGSSPAEAQDLIKGTLADFKNELLHSRFGINYNDLPAIFRKGSLVFKRKDESVVEFENDVPVKRLKAMVVFTHEDLIRDSFWNENPSILGVSSSKKSQKRSTAVEKHETSSSTPEDGT